MNTFETLSRDAVEPVELKRDAETSPDAARRIRAELDGLIAELAEAKEAVAYLEARENELVAEKAELARSLDDSRQRLEDFAADVGTVERGLRRQVADARLATERFRNALDAALNDVAIWRRAAFWFGVSSALAVVVAIAAL
jgi:uncharacterized membrane protein YccC